MKITTIETTKTQASYSVTVASAEGASSHYRVDVSAEKGPRVWDPVAEHYTQCHSLDERDMNAIKLRFASDLATAAAVEAHRVAFAAHQDELRALTKELEHAEWRGDLTAVDRIKRVQREAIRRHESLGGAQ